jgi:hypothetical protein
MKFLLFFFPLFAFANDYIAENRLDAQKDLIEVYEMNISSAPESWKDYQTDTCNMYDRNVKNEDELRATGLRRCRDGSVSFVQPKSDGWNGWEGKCGHTAASNTLYHICRKAMDPEVYMSKFLSDVTPGVLPRTLKKGITKVFEENKLDCPSKNTWSYSKLKNENNFLKNVKQFIFPKYSHPNLNTINRNGKNYFRNPIMSLVQNPGGNYLHWVTIVDIVSKKDSCEFVVNHWDNQYQVPCKVFSQWSKKVGRTYLGILKSYSTVTFQ